MHDFNPFSKKCSKLTSSDIEKLVENSVAEGWFVEYKEQPVSTLRTAHSIASFANSEGGWYILGIKADEDNVAVEIAGFSIEDFKKPKERLRDVVKSKISPTPFFESKLVTLKNGRVILVAHIPRGDETPYVTSDGRIYRRVNEGSDPIPEQDRYSIQKLFERGSERRNFIERFCDNPFAMSVAQSEAAQSFLEAYFLTQPVNRFEINKFYDESKFQKIFKAFSSPTRFLRIEATGHIKFNYMQSSTDSYIVRVVESPPQSTLLSPCIEIFRNGSARILLSINIIELHPLNGMINKVYLGLSPGTSKPST